MTRPSFLFPGSRPILFVLVLLMLAPPACVKRSRVVTSSHIKKTTQSIEANDRQPLSRTNADESNQSGPQRININTAAANELEALPGVGKGLAERIVDHRVGFGPFRRPEHLIIVRGISD